MVDTDFYGNALDFACKDTVLGKSKLLQLHVVGVCVTLACVYNIAIKSEMN